MSNKYTTLPLPGIQVTSLMDCVSIIAPISVVQELEPDLKAVAVNCFLSTSDSFDSSSLRHLSLKMSMEYSVTPTAKRSRRSFGRLDNWGIWGLGKEETGTDMFPKTGHEFSVWAYTANVQATQPKPYKRSLIECLDGFPVNSFSGESINEAFTLRASSPKQCKGNKNHPNTFVAVKGRLGEDPWGVDEAPCLTSQEWTRRLDIKRKNGGGAGFAILHKSPAGDRHFFDNAPCLRSLPSTNGKQAGSGAYKVREFQGEQWLERPITATEAERLMGWEEGSTAKGVTADGKKIEISTTQRIKMLGNGIIPAEITEILEALKPILGEEDNATVQP